MQVGQWDMFKIGVPNANTYENPFEDVSLNATFRAPDGRTLEFYGFYNTDSWQLRFMPDTLGTWSYEATFSDNAPGVSGTFACISSNIPGLIHKDANNPTWFGYKGGRPLLVRSFHIGDCFFANENNTVSGDAWNPDIRTAFLDWAQNQGYNMLSIASHYLNRAGRTRGQIRGEGWVTPNLWDSDSQMPRPAEYEKMETVLNDLAQRQMLIYPFAGFLGRESNHPKDPARQEAYIRYTITRLAPYWNVLFMVGGPEPHMKNGRYLTPENVNRIGQFIRDNDPFDHLVSVHNPTGDDYFRQEDWVSYVILQGPKTVDREKLYKDHIRNSYPAKPLYAQETLWPGNELHSNRIGRDYTPDDIRKNAFTMLFSGATINFADMDGLSSSGFSGRPDLALKKQPIHDIMHRVWDAFGTFPFYILSPNRDLVTNGYCLADAEAQRIVVYFHTQTAFNITCEGTYRAEWINPQHPTERKEIGLVTSKDQLHTPNDRDDWILDLIQTGDSVADQIHLSWSEDPATSLTVTWHTETENAPTALTYRTPSGDWHEAAGESFPSPNTGQLHRVTLKELSPKTSYDYRVAGGPVYRTRTAPDNSSDYTFAFICDTGLIGRLDGNATGTRQIINEVLRDQPDFILGGGDYAYGNKDGRFKKMGDAIDTWFLQWQDVLAQYPFMAQYGNHEIHLVERFEDWGPRFAHPNGFDENRNYSFDVGNVHFTSIFLPKNDLTEEQLAYIDADLAQARDRDIPWLIVFQHEAMYGHGTSHPARPENRAALAPIFERHKVDLHLSCHDQNYERTFPLTEVPDNPTPGSTDLNRYAKGKGVIYAKISPSGKKSEIGHQFSQFTTEQQDFMAVRDCTAHHYALVHVKTAGDIAVEVFSVVGDGSAKTLLDTFTISAQ